VAVRVAVEVKVDVTRLIDTPVAVSGSETVTIFVNVEMLQELDGVGRQLHAEEMRLLLHSDGI
jgi:hypothetical protein